MKLKAFYKDLKVVILKHFKPHEPEKESVEVLLIKHIQHLQATQKHLNEIRDGLAPAIRELKNDELFREVDRLAAMAPSEKTVIQPDSTEDIMFI